MVEEKGKISFNKELSLPRKEKIQMEIKAAKRILNQKVEPLSIADNLFHDYYLLMLDGIKKRNPNHTKEELIEKIKFSLTFNDKINLVKHSD